MSGRSISHLSSMVNWVGFRGMAEYLLQDTIRSAEKILPPLRYPLVAIVSYRLLNL
jgi:hypothetical protein